MPSYDHRDYRQNNYVNPVIDQSCQPLVPPFYTRDDMQRVPAGTQFDGTTPITSDQGKWGDLTGPAHGGRWAYAEDVMMLSFDFVSAGAEGAARGAGSALYVVRRNVEIMLMSLENIKQWAVFTEPILVKQGEIIRLKTFGATKEMMGVPTVQPYRIYL
jgi:hypothetical protein